ncbi:hypothetical protein B296_00002682 [Ensete ventricosum]|uniref:Uncharacterized protein n=1 Tax=Ensete ventricosum TaxID=4639 RepID=A0A427B1X8_ENSVE|nr:hypothetical protein B296_00002682 [Ensete ventricosum]
MATWSVGPPRALCPQVAVALQVTTPMGTTPQVVVLQAAAPASVSLDKLFLKCHIQLNQLWFLIQCSIISGYFYDFTEERTMMLKVFPDDDLGSTAHDRKKEQEKGIHMTSTTMMPSISMLYYLNMAMCSYLE